MNAGDKGRSPRSVTFNEGVAFRGSRVAYISRDEPSTAWIDFSYDDQQEIGTYRATIPSEKIERAYSELAASGYKALVDNSKPVPPDSLSVSFMEDEASEFISFTKPNIPRRIEPAVTEFRFLIDWLRQFPLATLHVGAEWKKNPIRVGDPLEFVVRFESIGSEPIAIGNPLRPELHRGMLKLAVSADGKNWTYADLTESNRVLSSTVREGEEISIASKGVWELRFRKQIHLTTGVHEVQLKYDSYLQSSADSPNVDGQVPIKLPDLVVQ